MKIILVSNYFYPQNSPRAFRTTELAKAFSRQGHKVNVIVPSHGYDYTEFLNDYPNIVIKQGAEISEKPLKIIFLLRYAFIINQYITYN